MIQYDTIEEFNARRSTCRLRPILQIELDTPIRTDQHHTGRIFYRLVSLLSFLRIRRRLSHFMRYINPRLTYLLTYLEHYCFDFTKI